MNIKLFTALFLIIALSACNKEPEQHVTAQTDRPTLTAQFEQSDEMISKILINLMIQIQHWMIRPESYVKIILKNTNRITCQIYLN
ncbi:hypothetical protein FHR28_001981 [Acinetobacter sp. BIGb0196]|nr:hypothetical protein [Acinetobacter guillouiae]MCW2250830.1 hypothetical protein [Acinetobacter sp. BIGb0204]NII37072.1 hypothetical protein [Acinetobacter sp. BIGb0196]